MVERWAVPIRPKSKKGFKRGLAQVSPLGLPFFETVNFLLELPKLVSVEEGSLQELPPLDQGLNRAILESCLSGMHPISCSLALGGGWGLFWYFFSFSLEVG